jgi:hypothetical protein
MDIRGLSFGDRQELLWRLEREKVPSYGMIKFGKDDDRIEKVSIHVGN